MSNQVITDYLTKEIFINKNIVTYRSLSREFSIHVNIAKNELATYHHNAPYHSQQCSAMFLLSGVLVPRGKEWRSSQSQSQVQTQPDTQDEDVNMDATQHETTQQYQSQAMSLEEDFEEEDSEEVDEIVILIVNEKDFEGAKARYLEIHSISVYSLSAAPLIDAALICDKTEEVRAVDRSKGPEWPAKIGRLVGPDVKMRASKKGKAHVIVPPAGPSKLKPSGLSVPAISGSSTGSQDSKLTVSKSEAKIKTEPSTSSFYAKDKDKEKKPTGKLNFFAKPKDVPSTAATSSGDNKEKDQPKGSKKEKEEVKAKEEAKVKEQVVVKKEQPADTAKKMFFSSSVTAKSKKEEKAKPASLSSSEESPKDVPTFKVGPPRGVKRKSSAALSREPTAIEPTTKGKEKVQEPTKGARARGKVIVSEDEDGEIEPKTKGSRRAKSRASIRSFDSEKSRVVDSDVEREGRALMDMDDDQVERISHAPSTVVSPSDNSVGEDGGTASEEDNAPVVETKAKETDEDVDMDDDTQPKQKRKRKPKVVIPVGKNGIQKRKITKTRVIKNAKGYMLREDYSEWESVEEEEEEEESEPEEKKTKGPKMVAEKKEDKKKIKPPAAITKKEKVPEQSTSTTDDKEQEVKAEKKKVDKDKPVKKPKKPAGNAKTQKGLMMNFFKKT